MIQKKIVARVKLYQGILLGILLASGLSVLAFTEPTVAPPGGNVAAPINVSGTAQTKAGNLTVSTMFANNFAVPAGTEGDITNIDEIIGFNDLILRGNTTNAAPIYLEGSKIILNNDTGTGNVGIGTATVGEKLTVAGNIRGDGFCIGTGACITSWPSGGGLTGGGTINFLSKFTASGTLGNSQIFDDGTSVGIGTPIPGQKLTVAGTIESTLGGFKFPDGTTQTTAATGGGGVWATSGSNISNTNSGNVGIGTQLPEAKLHVRGTATWGTALDLDARDVAGGRQWRLASTGGDAGQGQGKFVLYDQTAGQNRLVVDTSGNVGIGTTNTIVNFEVFKSSGAAGPIVRFRNDSTGYAYAEFINSNNLFRIGKESSSGGALLSGSFANAGILATQGANPIQFGTNDAVAMTILSGGNVGIGTTNPSDKLQVSGGNIRLDNGYELYFADNGQIRSSDNNHRILFRRSENKLELREYGDIVFSPGSTSGQETAKVVFKSDGNVCLSGICKSQWPLSGGLNPWYFVVGGNGALYYKVGVGGSWSEVPGGCCVSTVGLSAARDYSDSIHVVARGGDGQAYRKIFYKSGLWSGWDLVAGGSFPGVPAVETRD